MTFVFTFPDVGEGLTEGTIVKWLVTVGDTIAADQAVAQVSTDKSVVDLPSPQSGTISKLVVSEGTTVTVGDAIMELGGESAQAPDATAPTSAKEEPAAASAPVATSTPEPVSAPVSSPTVLTSTDNSSDILALPKVRKYARDNHKDLTSVRGTGNFGQITMQDVGGATEVTTTIPASAPVAKKTAASSVSTPSIPITPTTTITPKDILATPAIRKYAREQGVDITTVTGTDVHGRISKSDVDNAKNGTANTSATPEVSSTQEARPESFAQAPVQQVSVAQNAGTTEQISGIRKIISSRMQESLTHTAQVTHTDTANVTALVDLRTHEKERLAKQGIKLSYLPFFMKAVVVALRRFPHFNGVFNEQDGTFQLFDTYDIGIAVDTPNGLVVPVIRDANKKTIIQLAQEIVELAGKAQEGKLTPQEMKGSTFTISSVGSLGGKVFTPIINYPEIGILGIGRITDEAAVIDGSITAIKQLWFSLTFDHRAVDGADAARFLNEIITLVEDPDLLLLEL